MARRAATTPPARSRRAGLCLMEEACAATRRRLTRVRACVPACLRARLARGGAARAGPREGEGRWEVAGRGRWEVAGRGRLAVGGWRLEISSLVVGGCYCHACMYSGPRRMASKTQHGPRPRRPQIIGDSLLQAPWCRCRHQHRGDYRVRPASEARLISSKTRMEAVARSARSFTGGRRGGTWEEVLLLLPCNSTSRSRSGAWAAQRSASGRCADGQRKSA